MEKVNNWNNSILPVFWSEIAASDHLVQIYESEKIFLNTLEGFVGDGFIKKESVIVIATKEHLKELNERLKSQGFDIANLNRRGQYITADAEESLSKFMVGDSPDEVLFNNFAVELMNRAQKNLKIRAFGEMVALLWARGYKEATVKLEHLWHTLQQKELFCLYCACPKSAFTQDTENSIRTICYTHSKIIDGNAHASTEIYYK